MHSAGLLCCARRLRKTHCSLTRSASSSCRSLRLRHTTRTRAPKVCPSASSSRPLCQLVKVRPARLHAPIRRGQDSRPSSASVLGRPFASGVAPLPEPAEPTSPPSPCQGRINRGRRSAHEIRTAVTVDTGYPAERSFWSASVTQSLYHRPNAMSSGESVPIAGGGPLAG